MARRRVITLLSGGLLALAASLVGIAGVASAHVPQATLTCSNGSPVLSISLTYYSHSTTQHNTVAASIDGTSVLSPPTSTPATPTASPPVLATSATRRRS